MYASLPTNTFYYEVLIHTVKSMLCNKLLNKNLKVHHAGKWGLLSVIILLDVVKTKLLDDIVLKINIL